MDEQTDYHTMKRSRDFWHREYFNLADNTLRPIARELAELKKRYTDLEAYVLNSYKDDTND